MVHEANRTNSLVTANEQKNLAMSVVITTNYVTFTDSGENTCGQYL